MMMVIMALTVNSDSGRDRGSDSDEDGGANEYDGGGLFGDGGQ
jgi:hypothetical protein